MIYHVVDLGKDYPGKILNFAEARNSFLRILPDNEYILYKDSDVDAPSMLLDYLDRLAPLYPWYDIRQVNLINDVYQPLQNPFYTGVLVGKKCWWEGKVHEKVYPRDPHGRIDIPLIHNHHGPYRYNGAPSKPLLVLKKLWEIVKFEGFKQFNEAEQRFLESREPVVQA